MVRTQTRAPVGGDLCGHCALLCTTISTSQLGIPLAVLRIAKSAWWPERAVHLCGGQEPLEHGEDDHVEGDHDAEDLTGDRPALVVPARTRERVNELPRKDEEGPRRTHLLSRVTRSGKGCCMTRKYVCSKRAATSSQLYMPATSSCCLCGSCRSTSSCCSSP